jgi:hypothetical protein
LFAKEESEETDGSMDECVVKKRKARREDQSAKKTMQKAGRSRVAPAGGGSHFARKQPEKACWLCNILSIVIVVSSIEDSIFDIQNPVELRQRKTRRLPKQSSDRLEEENPHRLLGRKFGKFVERRRRSQSIVLFYAGIIECIQFVISFCRHCRFQILDNLLVEVVVDTFNLFTRLNRFFWIRQSVIVWCEALFFQNVCSSIRVEAK